VRVGVTVGVGVKSAGGIDSLYPPRVGEGAGVSVPVGVASSAGMGVSVRVSIVVVSSLMPVVVGIKTTGVGCSIFSEPASGRGGKGLSGP